MRVRNIGSCVMAMCVVGVFAHAADAQSGAGTINDGGAWYAQMFEAAMFYLFGGLTVISAIGVCVSRKIDRMAVALFFTLGCVAVLFFLLAANYVAAVQLIVYVGGVLVLLIFGVMLTSKSPWVRFDVKPGELIAAGLVSTMLLMCLLVLLTNADWITDSGQAHAEPIKAIGRSLVTQYLVPFEAAGVLLMIVMVGAAHLARQEK